jgi:hypothetical protein
MNKIHLLHLLCAGLAAAGVPDPSAFPLVDGAVEAVIVGGGDIPACPENGYKAKPAFLRGYIEKSTGRKLRQVSEAEYDPAAMPRAIFLGDTRAARDRFGNVLRNLDRDSYVVSVESNAVYLIGARPHSSEYAQADFLRTSLGIDTYIPTRWGTIVPRHETVRIPAGFRLETPAFNSRAFSGIRFWEEKPGAIDYSGNTEIGWRLYRRDQFSHNLHTFIPVEEFGKTHPDYFPEIDGQRVLVSASTDPGPCIANPGVQAAVLQKVRAFFDDPANKDRDIISLGMTDGGWCECAACRALDGPDIRGERTHSRRYYTFLNAVAKGLRETHPGKSIGVLAYAGAELPPADLTVERNIVPYICSQRSTWGDPEVRLGHLEQAFEWTARVDKIGIYEYLYGSGFLVPRLYNRHLADYLRAVRSQGNGGFYAEIYSNHGLDGPKAWIVEKLLWNPYQDPDQLRAQWCQAVFEEAAEPMDAYFALLEDANTRNIGRTPTPAQGYPKERSSKFYLMGDAAQFEWFPREDVAAAKALLEKARQAAKRPAIRERVDYFAAAFKVTDLFTQSYYAYEPARRAMAQHALPAQVLASLIEGDAKGPAEDPEGYLKELVEREPTAFTLNFPISVTTATELLLQLMNATGWQTVRDSLKQGVRNPDALRESARKAVAALAPKNQAIKADADRRMSQLLAMAGRVAVAVKTAAPPAIDGDLSDAAWKWKGDNPWWFRKTGAPFESPARYAFCHDGRFLYAAFEFGQPDLDKEGQNERYGAAAWKYPSVELFLHPDISMADPKDVPFFQAIPCVGGGLYASKHQVVTEWKSGNTKDRWWTELKIDLQAVGMSPDRFPALRMNMSRNLREHAIRSWYPVADANNDPLARGWLVFE